MKKQPTQDSPALPPVLYHYTTIGALYSIINGIKKIEDHNVFELYATHYAYANDPTEYKFFNDCLYKGLYDLESGRELKHLISDEFRKYISDMDFFLGQPAIVSFADAKDNLAMWRMYGSNGLGVAIGIDPQIATKIKGRIKLSPCMYYEEEKLIQKLIESGLLEKVYNQLSIQDEGGGGLDFDLILSITTNRIFTKPSCYSLEREWRIIRACPDSEYDYRERNGLIIPYVPFQLDVDCIKKICIGPCAEKELHAYAIKNFLAKKLGKDELDGIDIEFSKNPYVIR